MVNKKAGHKKPLNGRQKAAIFIFILGSEVSSVIFKHLRKDEIEQLTVEKTYPENIHPQDREHVLSEFIELMVAEGFSINFEEQTMDPELSVNEQASLQTQGITLNLAKEYPEDTARMIRIWLVEE